jgi:hypothetical protein
VEVTARAIDDEQWHNLLRIGGVLLAIGLFALLYRFISRLPAATLQSRTLAILLLIAGLLSLLSGIFPILGLVAAVTSTILLTRRLWHRSATSTNFVP